MDRRVRTLLRNPDAAAYSDRSRREANASAAGRYAAGAYGSSSRDPDRPQLRDALLGAHGVHKPAIDPDTLSEVLTHLFVDDEGARQIQVSPKRAIERMHFLSDEKKRALLAVESEFMQQLGKAAYRYKRAAQGYGPLGGGPKGGARGRVDELIGGGGSFGKSSSRGGGWAGWLSRDRPGGLGLAGHSGSAIPPNVGRGDVPSGAGEGGGLGGLSRGQVTAMGLGGRTGSGAPSLPQIGPSVKPYFGGFDLSGFGLRLPGPLNNDPLLRANLYHRLNPGAAVSGNDPDVGVDSPDESDGSTEETPEQRAERELIENAWQTPQADYHSSYEGTNDFSYVVLGHGLPGDFAKIDQQKVMDDIRYNFEYMQQQLGQRPHVDPSDNPQPDLPRPGPSSKPKKPWEQTPNPDDPDGPVGPWLAEHYHMAGADRFTPNPYDPGGGGPIGPWLRLYMPNPEDPVGPIGPWARTRGDRWGRVAMPNPDDPYGPVGPTLRRSRAWAAK